jgi:branched-chain amino acid transport system permease protein
MNWNLFVTELVAGITHGSVYALIALGYSMVYGILKLLNFAHGDIYMVGAFIGYGLITVFGGPEQLSLNVALLLALMFICAMLGGGLVGVMIERFAYRRLRDAPRIAPLITALGVSFFLENGSYSARSSTATTASAGRTTRSPSTASRFPRRRASAMRR